MSTSSSFLVSGTTFRTYIRCPLRTSFGLFHRTIAAGIFEYFSRQDSCDILGSGDRWEKNWGLGLAQSWCC